MGEAPGTVAVIEADRPAPAAHGEDLVPMVDAHSMSPEIVLGTLARLGGTIERVYVVGCQPACLDEGLGLSPVVAEAVDGAVELCHQLIVDLVTPVGKGTGT